MRANILIHKGNSIASDKRIASNRPIVASNSEPVSYVSLINFSKEEIIRRYLHLVELDDNATSSE